MNKRIQKFFRNLRYKYRLVIYNESTFEVESDFLLTRLNIILLFCFMILLSLGISMLLVTYTPLKYYMPGYGDAGMRKQLRDLTATTDEMQKKIDQHELWAKNIQQVLSGDIPADKKYDPKEEMPDSLKKK